MSKDDVIRSVSLKIKNAREARGLSQRALAEMAGLSSGYLGMVEANKLLPSLKSLEKIARVLNVDASYFVEKEKYVDKQVSFSEFVEHLDPAQQEFIAKQKSGPWITLASELDQKGLTPEKVRSLLDVIRSINGSK